MLTATTKSQWKALVGISQINFERFFSVVACDPNANGFSQSVLKGTILHRGHRCCEWLLRKMLSRLFVGPHLSIVVLAVAALSTNVGAV